MRKHALRTCVVLALASFGYGQTFEVASLKVVPPDSRGRTSIEPTPGNLAIRNASLGFVIGWAYTLGPERVSNPDVIRAVDQRFEIIAKAAGPAKTDDMRLMLRALLAERFKLVTHFESKTVSAYALVEAKGGHKLKVSDAPDGQGVLPVNQPGKMALGGKSAKLEQLAMFLSGPLRTPVIDMTGLKERYDFDFDISTFFAQQPGTAPGEGEQEQRDPVSILQSALPKQLGLKLESRKMPVDMLVIDSVAKVPTLN